MNLYTILDDLLGWLSPKVDTDIDGVSIVRDGWQTVDLEDHLDRPRRKRGRREFRTPEGFAGYVGRHQGDGSAVTIVGEEERHTILATLDDHSAEAPGHDDHRAVLRMVESRELLAWRGVCGEPIGQRQLVEHIDQWMTTIAEPEAAALEGLQTLRVRDNAEVESRIEMGSGDTRLTVTGGSSVRAGADRAEVTVPGRLKLVMPIFDRGQHRLVTVAVRTVVRERAVTFDLEMLDLDLAIRAEFEAWVAQVAELTKLPVWV